MLLPRPCTPPTPTVTAPHGVTGRTPPRPTFPLPPPSLHLHSAQELQEVSEREETRGGADIVPFFRAPKIRRFALLMSSRRRHTQWRRRNDPFDEAVFPASPSCRGVIMRARHLLDIKKPHRSVWPVSPLASSPADLRDSP